MMALNVAELFVGPPLAEADHITPQHLLALRPSSASSASRPWR